MERKDPFDNELNNVDYKWLFTIKRYSNGTIARYKARLVPKGYLQDASIDFLDTFNLVAKQSTSRIVLHCALFSLAYPTTRHL